MLSPVCLRTGGLGAELFNESMKVSGLSKKWSCPDEGRAGLGYKDEDEASVKLFLIGGGGGG